MSKTKPLIEDEQAIDHDKYAKHTNALMRGSWLYESIQNGELTLQKVTPEQYAYLKYYCQYFGL